MRGLDRLLVAAALLLVLAVAVDALRSRDGGRGPSGAPAPATTSAPDGTAPQPGERATVPASIGAPVPEQVRLVPSSTTFLPRCPASSLALAVGPGAQLVLRFTGPRCHLPPLHLRASVRDGAGRVVYRGPALAAEELSGNFAGSGLRRARLVVGCGAEPLVATVTGSGLSARAPIRCRGAR